MSKDKYKDVEDFFREPLTLRQKLIAIKLQIIHEILTAWKFWKTKLIFVLIGVMLGWIIGLPVGAWLGHKNDQFWQSTILEPDRMGQVKILTEKKEGMVERLTDLEQAIRDYWMPSSSPDIPRVSEK